MPARKHLAVVGAGVFGLFCARAALDAGWRVSVIDPRSASADIGGRCASASAAGMIGPLSESLLEPAGANPKLFLLALAALHLWAERGEGLLGPAYQKIGALHVGGRDHGDALIALAERARAHDLAVKVVRGGAVRAAWPGLGFRASLAVRLDDEALVQPQAAMAVLQKALSGVCRFGVAVTEVSRIGAHWRVALSDGETLSADEVLLSPGFAVSALGWAPSLGVLVPAAGVMALLGAPAAPNCVVRGPGFYLAPRGDGAVSLGSSMQFGADDTKPDVKELRKLAARLFDFSPMMKSAPELARWAGVRAMSPDWAPLIGRDAETGLLVAAGAGRNGWLFGPLAGDMIGAYLGERETPRDWAAFDPNRFSLEVPPSPA
jgi:glycine oxidase